VHGHQAANKRERLIDEFTGDKINAADEATLLIITERRAKDIILDYTRYIRDSLMAIHLDSDDSLFTICFIAYRNSTIRSSRPHDDVSRRSPGKLQCVRRD